MNNETQKIYKYLQKHLELLQKYQEALSPAIADNEIIHEYRENLTKAFSKLKKEIKNLKGE